MKGLLILTGWCLLFQVALSQTRPLLPVVQKGKWKLIDTAGNFILDTPYDFISLFDVSGTALVRKNNAYGVIDHFGNELIPTKHHQIKQLRFGMYGLHEKSGWSIIRPKINQEPILSQLKELPEPLSENWLEFERDSMKWLLNMPSSRLIPVHDSTAIRWVFSEYLLLQKSMRGTFYSPLGEIIAHDTINYLQDPNFIFVITPTKNYLLNSQGEVAFKDSVRTIHWNYDYSITAIFDQYIQLYSIPDFKLLLQLPVSDLSIYDDTFYYITNKNGTVNLLNKLTKQKRFPDKYTVLFEMADFYYAQDSKGILYLLTANGKEFLKGAYSSLYTDGKFIHTGINSLHGLYSCKTGQEILPAIYSGIQISNLTIKAYRPKAMVALKLDNAHHIVDRMYMENPYNINTIGPPTSQRPTLEPRLRALGWYIDSIEHEDKLGNIFFSYRIGLKDQNDSLLHKPDLGNLRYLSNEFAVYSTPKKRIKYAPGHDADFAFYQILLNQTGKSYMSPILVDYDSTDLKTKTFMRVSTIDNFCILTDSGTLIPFLYIEPNFNTNLVYCKEALVKKEKKQSELTLRVPNIYLQGTGYEFQKPYLGIDRFKEFVRFEKGKWNYLTPTGQPLLQEDLDFAHPFVGSKAIVNSKGKWGVIESDSVIIPCIYDQIERIINDKDTFFICKQNKPGYLILDSLLSPIAGPTNCLSSNGEIAVVEQKGKQYMLNKNYEELGDEQNYFKTYENGFYVYKLKKDYHILSTTGEEIGHTKVKLKRFVFDRYGVFETGSKFGLVSLDGDTLLPALYSEFETFGTKLLALKNGGGVLFDTDLKELFSFETGKLLVDESSDLYAYTNKSLTTVYDLNGKRIKKFKNLIPDYLVNGKLICVGKQGLITTISTQQVDSLNDIKTVHRFSNGYVAIQLNSNNHLFYDNHWKLLFGNDSAVRKINYLGAFVFEIRTKKNGTCVYNFKNNTRIDHIDGVEGTLENNRLLIQQNKKYYYVNDSLKRISNYEYSQAKPFVGNRAAVLDFYGWTLIDTENNLLSYPDFNELTVYSSYFIKAKNRSHYGMYSNSGKVIIPCEYEKLVFVNKKLVQTFLHGEVKYFRTSNGSIIR